MYISGVHDGKKVRQKELFVLLLHTYMYLLNAAPT